MKKIILILLIFPSLLFSQIKVKNLPKTTTGTVNDYLIKDDAAGTTNSTKIIKVSDFITTYGLSGGGSVDTTRLWNINGNTLASDTNFIGSIDSANFSIKTDNTVRALFTKDGQNSIISGQQQITVNNTYSSITSDNDGFGENFVYVQDSECAIGNSSRGTFFVGDSSNNIQGILLSAEIMKIRNDTAISVISPEIKSISGDSEIKQNTSFVKITGGGGLNGGARMNLTSGNWSIGTDTTDGASGGYIFGFNDDAGIFSQNIGNPTFGAFIGINSDTVSNSSSDNITVGDTAILVKHSDAIMLRTPNLYLGNTPPQASSDTTVSKMLFRNVATGEIEWGGVAGSGGGGSITLDTIGVTPNANGSTLTGSVLNLEPASASFGGVVTTGSQTFGGVKTFTSPIFNTQATVPKLYGGTAVGSGINFTSTTGTGTTTGLAFSFNGGTNGATNIANIYNDGQFLIGTTTRNPTSLGVLRIGQGTSTIDIGEQAVGVGGIWINQATPSSTNYTIRGGSTTVVNGGAGNTVFIAITGTNRYQFSSTLSIFTPTTSSTATEIFKFVSPASTTVTASAEVNGFTYSLATNRQWNTGALATQREFLISAPTYRFVGASTITDAATFEVSGSPVAGTNATITRAWAARLLGNVAIGGQMHVGVAAGTTAPSAFISVAAGTTTVAQMNFASSTLKTTPVAGDLEYSSGHLYITDGARHGISTSAGVKTSTTTVANTVTETTIYSYTFAANELHQDEFVQCKLSGIVSNASASDDYDINIYVGGSLVHTINRVGGNVTNAGWDLEYYGTIRSTGAGGTFVDQIMFNEGTLSYSEGDTSTHSINTTTTQAFEIKIQWNNANASNTLSATQGLLMFSH